MENLFELSRDVAKELKKGGLWEGTSTASTTTSLTDAGIGLIENAVNGGTIWFFDETPLLTREIVALSAAGVVTWTDAVANLSGAQRYMIFGSVWPRHALRSAVNQALANIGEFPEYDTFSSVGLQEDYDLTAAAPVGVPAAERIMSVERSAYSDPSTADNPSWILHLGWTQFGNTLRFLTDPPVYDGTLNMRVGWNIPHPELLLDITEIRREVSPRRLKWEAVTEAYMHLIGPRDSKATDEQTENLFNRATVQAGKFPSHGNQPLPEPMLLMGVGSRGGAAVNIDLQV